MTEEKPEEPFQPEGPEGQGDSQEAFDAEFANLVSKLGDLGDEPEPDGPDENSQLDLPVEEAPALTESRATACFLTPVASAEALAALCALSGISAVVVPTEAGAVVVQSLDLAEEQWEMALLAESLHELDADIDAIASQLSEVIRMPVVVFAALLAPGTEQEPGVTGQVLAGRWAKKAFETDLPAGLVIAQLPLLLEELVLGRMDPATAPGAWDTQNIPRWKALQMLGRGMKEPRRGRKKSGRSEDAESGEEGGDTK